MKLKRMSIAGVAVVVGAGILAGPKIFALAQTLAGVSAAGAAGATLGAAAGSGLLTPSQYARKATDAGRNRNAALDSQMPPSMPNADISENGPAAGGAEASMEAKPAAAHVQVEKWGNENGQQMLQQLTRHAHSQRSSSKSAKKGRKNSHSRGLAKYKKPPKGWLAYYLPEDRYKVTSNVWKYTTTPNDKYYYEPWVLATKHRPAGQVIGFHSWQDAMVAGYRPDPSSLPSPGRQLANMASYSKGPMMQKYIEYTYAGQIAPLVFSENYNYVMKVARQVAASKDWSYLLVPTVEQAIGATIGLTSPPTQLGALPEQEIKKDDEPGAPEDAENPEAPPAP